MPTFSLRRFSPLLIAFCLCASALMPCHAQAVYVPPVTQSTQVLYASKNGCALNSNLVTGGGTDDTAALQAALTAMAARGGGTVIIDGVALVSTLQIPSGVTLSGLGQSTGLFQKSGTSGPCVSNKNIVAGPTAPTDVNIGLKNLYINGNRAGGHGYVGAWSNPTELDASGKYVACVQFFGVSNLTVEDVQTYEPACFAFWISNVNHFLFRHIRCDDANPNRPGAGYYNQDGIHLNGYCSFGRIDDVRGLTNDDFIALNADDSYYQSASSDYGKSQAGSVQGPITDITINNICPESSISCFRILSSTSRVDRIKATGFGGSCQSQVLLIDSMPYFAGTGGGNIGSITLSDVDTLVNYTGGFISPTVIDVRANVENLMLRGIKRQNYLASSYPTVWVESGDTVGQLSLQGVDIRDSAAAYDPASHIKIDGIVPQCVITGLSWLQTYTTGTGTLIGGSGTISRLTMSSYAGPPRTLGGFAPAAKTGDAFSSSTSIAMLTPAAAGVGASVSIAGQNFTGATAVSFAGTTAAYSVVNDQKITATVPTGAATGNVSVTAPSGIATIPFTVSSSVFSDTFTRSDRSLAGDNGWSLVQGSNPFTITSNVAVLGNSVASVFPLMVNSAGFASSVTVQATINCSNTNSVGIVTNYNTSTNTGMLLDITSASGDALVTLYRITAVNAFTQVGSPVTIAGAFPANTPSLFKVVRSSSGTMTLYLGASSTASASFTDTTYIGAGVTGMRSGGSTSGTRTVSLFSVTSP